MSSGIQPTEMPTSGNPLVSLLMAIIRAAIYCLQLTRQLVTFLTLTLPRIMIMLVNWSWTVQVSLFLSRAGCRMFRYMLQDRTHPQPSCLQLSFPIVLFVLGLIPVGFFLLVRYKYLNKYTTLKEDPYVIFQSLVNLIHAEWNMFRFYSLSKPEKNTLHPDVLAESSTKPLNNYLEEYLSAIKVFGFLEKPVSSLLQSSKPTYILK